MSTTQLLARAHSVAADATGVRMVGTLQDPTGPIKIDIKYGQTGSSGRLTVNGNSVDIVEVGGAVYYRPSDAFFKAALGPDDAVDVLAVTAGRWITGGAGEPFFARMTPLVDRSKQLAIVFSVAGKMKRLAPRTVDGVPCLSLGDADGALYVSASDARPIRLAAADHSVLNFSDYGAVAEPVAPERINTVQAVDLGL